MKFLFYIIFAFLFATNSFGQKSDTIYNKSFISTQFRMGVNQGEIFLGVGYRYKKKAAFGLDLRSFLFKDIVGVNAFLKYGSSFFTKYLKSYSVA